MSVQKISQLLGLAQRAGKIVSGEEMIEKAFKQNKIKLLVLASDASEATKKNYQHLASKYNTPCYMVMEKQVLGQAIGKNERAAIALLDVGFAKALEQKISKRES